MDSVLEFVLSQDPVLVILLLIILSALENVFPPVPADVAAALGAFWAVRAGVSPVLVGFLCFLGNQASAFGVYFWVRARGDAVLRSREFQLLLPQEIQPAVRGYIDRFGAVGIFLSRFLPGLRAGVLPFAAINGLSPLRSLGPAAMASLLWYAALTAGGSALGLAYDQVKASVARVTGALGALGAIIAIAGLFLLFRAGRKARARRLARKAARPSP
jgi:membrane protein DedA with SNARE-associated domain